MSGDWTPPQREAEERPAPWTPGRPETDAPPPPAAWTPQPAPTPAEPSGEPGWTAWQVVAAFAASLGGTLVVVGAVLAIVGSIAGSNLEDPPPALNILGVILQDTVLLAAAIGFAAMTRRPRPRHFGLRAARFWPAIGWTAVGAVGFIAFNGIYTAIFEPHGEQEVAEALGVKESDAALVVGGFVVIVLAPAIEELFFRGFFYRGLRNSFARGIGVTGGILLAALVDGIVFGAVHFTGSETLPILPVLAALGFMFCLVYEKTGSLYTVIALHVLVNTAAYSQIADGSEAVAAGFGGAMLLACVLLPRFMRGGEPPPVPQPAWSPPSA